MNEYDIDNAADLLSEHAPEIAPYAIFLRDWKDTVNANSDGWAYWRAGSACARKLSEMVETAVDCLRRSDPMPVPADFSKTLTPIRSFATRKGLEAPTLQETPAPAPGMR